MWINEIDALPLLDKLEDEVAQKCGLSGACLPDDAGVVTGICLVKTKRKLAVPGLPHADVKIMLIHL